MQLEASDHKMRTQTMTQTTDLDAYYSAIQTKGYLLTLAEAQRWSAAVLKTISLNLGRRAKKRLQKGLPAELAFIAGRPFMLLHFRDKTMPRELFLKQCARRAGATDPIFARQPVRAAFHALKDLLDDDTIQAVANDLAPEISQIWQEA